MSTLEEYQDQTAVLWTGLVSGIYEECMQRASILLPFTNFYGHWIGRDTPPVNNYYSFDEPKSHYDPPFDLPESLNVNRKAWFDIVYEDAQKTGQSLARTKHGTHQILGHYLLLQQIPKKYKYIIRMRYDTLLSHKINWVDYMNYVYKDDCVLGFHLFPGCDPELKYQDKLIEITPQSDFYHTGFDKRYYLNDYVIMYQRWRLDAINVMSLFENKKLLGDEFGWAQVLCNMHINANKKNFFGGARITRSKSQLLKQNKLP